MTQHIVFLHKTCAHVKRSYETGYKVRLLAPVLNLNIMTIKELKEKIKDMPDNMDVMIEMTTDDGLYGLAQEAVIEKVTFQDEDIPKRQWAKVDCLVIRD